jgi:competence protein ComEC
VILGAALGRCWPGPGAAPWVLATGATALGLAAVAERRLGPLLAGSVALGLASALLVPVRDPLPPAADPLVVEARVAARARATPDGCALPLSGVFRAGPGRMLPLASRAEVRLSPCRDAPPPGERVRVRVRWRALPPGVPGPVRLLAVSPVVRVGAGPAPSARLERARQVASDRIAPDRGAGRALLASVLTGDRAFLDPGTRAAFRITGTAHLLAISGLHVGLVTGMLFFLVRLILLAWPSVVLWISPDRLAAVVAVAGTWLYVLFSGTSSPAVRAGIMGTALLLGRALGRRSEPRAALALAAALIVIVAPEALGSPGFQLSFAAVTGILLWARGRRPVGPRSGASLVLDLAWASVAATAFTVPVAAYHFGTVAGAGLVVNLLAVPLFAILVLPTGLLALLVALPLPTLGAPLLGLAAGSAEALLGIVDWGAAALGPAGSRAWQPGGMEVIAAYAVLLSLRHLGRGWARRLLVLGLALGLLGSGLRGLGPAGGAGLRVVAFDVGRADALLVTSADGEHLLVDAPGPTSTGYAVTEHRVIPGLRRLGVTRLHTVVATHPHADHLGGLPAILAAFPVGRVLHGGGTSPAPEWEALVRSAAARRVPLVAAPPAFRLGRARVTVLSGRAETVSPQHDENEAGLVLRVDQGAARVLLMADVEGAGERDLIGRGVDLRVDVLKVGHHGARRGTSAALLRAAAPAVALVSAPGGREATHPHPDVLRRLRRARVETLVTGLEGTVTVILAPWGITVARERGPVRHLGWPEAPDGWARAAVPGIPHLLPGQYRVTRSR